MFTLIQEETEREAAALNIEFLDRNARTGRTSTLGPVLWGNTGVGAEGVYGGHI